mmetsp:Transcript_13629/g.23936  ORF Transcript_13629/g.23936 Transcript_13629/m.23936 type:complete len:326 (-) Transcript_13629:408-1385(-)
MCCTNVRFLNHAGENLGGHLLAVLHPRVLVLVGATLVVAPGTVRQQDGEVERVEVRQRVGVQRRHAPHERGRYLGNVVEVSGERPPAGAEQQRGALFAIFSGVLGGDVIRLTAPHLRSAVRSTELLTLSVTIVVAPDAEETQREAEDGGGQGQVHGVLHEKVSVDGVHGRHVHQAAPADIVTGTVVLDVHRTEVSSLPVVELEQVHGLQHDGDHHGAGDVTAEEFVLLEGVADDAHLPVHQAEATVSELLDIEAEDTRVQLGAPEEVNHEASVGAGVLGGGEGQTLDGKHGAEAKSKHVQGGQNVTELVVHQGGSNHIIISQDKQ